MKIRTRVRSNGLATIYAKDRKRLEDKVKNGDMLLVRIKKVLVPLFILNAKGSWNIQIPKSVMKKTKLKEGEIVNINILDYSKDGIRYDPEKAIINNNKNYFIDSYYAIPDFLKHRNKRIIIFPVKDNEIFCSYKHAFPVKIKRFIPLNEFTLESFGLLQGELAKVGNNFLFGNTSPKIIKIILRFLEMLGVNKNHISFSVSYCKPYVNEAIRDKVKNFWSNICKITPNVIKFYYYQNGFGNGNKCSKNGTFTINVNSAMIVEIVWSLLDFVNKFLITNPKFAGYYLRGAFEADGTVLIKKSGNISSINISCASEEEVSMYKKAFKALKIKTKSNSRNYVYVDRKNVKEIDSWKFLWKLINIDIFKHNKENKVRLVKGFLKFRATKIVVKYLKYFEKKTSWTAGELRPHVLKYWNTTWVKKKLDDLTSLSLLERRNGIYYITEEGKRLLRFIKSNQ